MKRFLFTIALLIIGVSTVWAGVIYGSHPAVVSDAVGDGFVGNNAEQTDWSGDGAQGDVHFSLFTSSSGGTISYIHAELYGFANTGMMAIYDSSKNKLAQTVTFEGSGGAVYNVALESPIVISNTTQYYLAVGNIDDGYWGEYVTANGYIYEDAGGFDGTNMTSTLVTDSTISSTKTPRIWADNSAT